MSYPSTTNLQLFVQSSLQIQLCLKFCLQLLQLQLQLQQLWKQFCLSHSYYELFCDAIAMTVAIAIYNAYESHLLKISFCLDFFQTALTRPPLCFWNPLRNFFLTFFIRIKVPQSVWIFVVHQHFPWIMSKPRQKKVPHHLWNQVTPPPTPAPYLKMSKLKQKSSSNLWESGNPRPTSFR